MQLEILVDRTLVSTDDAPDERDCAQHVLGRKSNRICPHATTQRKRPSTLIFSNVRRNLLPRTPSIVNLGLGGTSLLAVKLYYSKGNKHP